jgi:hypothetical protein
LNLQVLVVAEAVPKVLRESEALKELKAFKELRVLAYRERKVERVLELKEPKELLDYKVLVEQQLTRPMKFQKVLQISTLQLIVSHMSTPKEQPITPGQLLII